MKDETHYKDCQTIGEILQRVNEYMLGHNTSRLQWGLKKMTPDEYKQEPSAFGLALFIMCLQTGSQFGDSSVALF